MKYHKSKNAEVYQ